MNEAVIKEDNDGIMNTYKTVINSQSDFDRTIINWEPILDAIILGGFESIFDKFGYSDLECPDMDEVGYKLRSAFENGVSLFPNLYKKFTETGYVNIQSEDSILQIYSKYRWDLLPDVIKNTPTSEIWYEGDYYEKCDTEDFTPNS